MSVRQDVSCKTVQGLLDRMFLCKKVQGLLDRMFVKQCKVC